MLGRSIKLAGKGFCIGSADVVPGVSGGTMAFILGIYPQLINAIKSFDSSWLRSLFTLDILGIRRPHFSFLIPVGIGVVCALLFFTRVISLPGLIRTDPEIIYGLFFGLILGSIFFLYKHLDTPIVPVQMFYVLLGIGFGAFVVTLVPSSTPDDSWFIFLCGAIAISAMILPGISGSFILLMMKKYAYIFDAIGNFEMSVILPFLAGIVVGIVLFSRFLSYLLAHFYRQTILFIGGLLLASLYVIWPFQDRVYAIVRDKERLMSSTPYIPEAFTSQAGYALLMVLIGMALVILLELLADK